MPNGIKGLSQNTGLVQGDVGELQMDKGQVIADLLFPTHKQTPREMLHDLEQLPPVPPAGACELVQRLPLGSRFRPLVDPGSVDSLRRKRGRTCRGWPGWPPRLRLRRLPPDGFGGLTMSLDGGLEDVEKPPSTGRFPQGVDHFPPATPQCVPQRPPLPRRSLGYHPR